MLRQGGGWQTFLALATSPHHSRCPQNSREFFFFFQFHHQDSSLEKFSPAPSFLRPHPLPTSPKTSSRPSISSKKQIKFSKRYSHHDRVASWMDVPPKMKNGGVLLNIQTTDISLFFHSVRPSIILSPVEELWYFNLVGVLIHILPSGLIDPIVIPLESYRLQFGLSAHLLAYLPPC
jgi:hypothetical protein